MKKLLALLTVISLTGCSLLREPTVQQYEPLDSYSYFYVTPTSDLTSSNRKIYSDKDGIHEKSETETLSPSEVISGKLIKKGMIRLPSLDRDILDKTLIVNYGESGRRTILVGEAIEVTIQFVSAKKHSIVYVCTAEGKGSTEPENVRVAINRALDTLFKE